MYLDVIVRVPVGVIDDDGVGGCQVDAQAPGPGRQQERKLGGARSCGTSQTNQGEWATHSVNAVWNIHKERKKSERKKERGLQMEGFVLLICRGSEENDKPKTTVYEYKNKETIM